MSFIAGAAVGALVVALTTPKSGSEVREGLKALGRRIKCKVGEAGDRAGEVCDEARERAGSAVADVKRGFQEAATDLRG